MKTKVRVLKKRPTKNSIDGQEYQILEVQFLRPIYKSDDRHLEPAFSIVWQASDGNPTWYGMRFNSDTDNIDHIKYMTKVACEIEKANLYYTEQTPEVILNVLNAERHVYDQGMFVPEKMNGCKFYVVIKDGRHYSSIHAMTETEAYKHLEEMKKSYPKDASCSLELSIERCEFKITDIKSDL